MKIVELWKHKEYTISEDGTITNKITGKVYKHSLNKEGYKVVKIKYQQHLVHRLLLLSFKLSTHFVDAYVDHIDGNKLNNKLDNLEWVTAKENAIRARKVIGYKQSIESIKIGANKQAVTKRKLSSTNILLIQEILDKIPTTNSSPMSIKQQRGAVVKELSLKHKVSISVIHRIARREGRYLDVN